MLILTYLMNHAPIMPRAFTQYDDVVKVVICSGTRGLPIQLFLCPGLVLTAKSGIDQGHQGHQRLVKTWKTTGFVEACLTNGSPTCDSHCSVFVIPDHVPNRDLVASQTCSVFKADVGPLSAGADVADSTLVS